MPYLNNVIELAKMFNNNFYWLEVLKKRFNLENSEMGYVINNLK